jgi:hypothetical protein
MQNAKEGKSPEGWLCYQGGLQKTDKCRCANARFPMKKGILLLVLHIEIRYMQFENNRWRNWTLTAAIRKAPTAVKPRNKRK